MVRLYAITKIGWFKQQILICRGSGGQITQSTIYHTLYPIEPSGLPSPSYYVSLPYLDVGSGKGVMEDGGTQKD